MIWDNVNGSGETGKKTVVDFKRIEFQNAILKYLRKTTSEVYRIDNIGKIFLSEYREKYGI